MVCTLQFSTAVNLWLGFPSLLSLASWAAFRELKGYVTLWCIDPVSMLCSSPHEPLVQMPSVTTVLVQAACVCRPVATDGTQKPG